MSNGPIDYIHAMLERWVAWQRDTPPACAGYADHSAYVVVKREAGAAYDEDEAIRTDAAVARITPRKVQLALICYYCHAVSYEDAAKRLHTNADTVRSRVYAAHRKLDAELSAVEGQFAEMR